MKSGRKSKKNKVSTIVSSAPQEFDWSYLSPVEVHVDGNFDRAFKNFRMMVQSEGIIAKYKEKQSYEKPSDKNRRKNNEAIRRVAELEMKQAKIASGEYDKEKVKKQKKKDQRSKANEQE